MIVTIRAVCVLARSARCPAGRLVGHPRLRLGACLLVEAVDGSELRDRHRDRGHEREQRRDDQDAVRQQGFS
jgi:hypothetical protein